LVKLEGTVDVSDKSETKRVAKATAFIKLNKEIKKLIKTNKLIKGDALEQARVAGILAAKKTYELLPLTHPLRISKIKISFLLTNFGIKINSEVVAIDRVGVEMEALTAVAVAALTIYDMCKMYSLDIEITDIMIVEKSGGKRAKFVEEK